MKGVLWTSLLMSASFGTVARAESPTGTLQVVVSGVEPRPGTLVVRVYASADHWLEPEGAIRTVVLDARDGAVARFEALPAGRYAVAVVHDENGNQRMDLAWLPYPHPVEGGGVSNDVRTRLGPPAFAPATFDLLPAEQSLSVTLRY